MTFKGALSPFLPSATLCWRVRQKFLVTGSCFFPCYSHSTLCSVSGLLPVCCGHVKEAESSYCNYWRFWAFFCASNPATQNRRKPLCPKPSYLLSHTAFSGKGRLWQSGEGTGHDPPIGPRATMCREHSRLPVGPTGPVGTSAP